MAEKDLVSQTFRALVEGADRKFARVRDVPAYGRVTSHHYFHKVFKAYTRLWKYQQEHRPELLKAGLNRWEIGEIASRIGQLYFGQYMRTSEARFLVEAYVFYEAILSRSYFEGSKGHGKDLAVRFKELRFYARFLLVALILNRTEMVKALVDRFKAVVDDSKAAFRETNFKEWRQVVQEIVRLMKVDTAFMNVRPLRYCAMFDSHPASVPYVARFHAKKVLKFKDALLTSYHRNEVKFAELTLDTFRMLQCLEWEQSGSFYQKRPAESNGNGTSIDHSGASGVIDINLAVDMTDPTLPPNPRKAILYRPSVTHLIAVMATISEELPPDSVMLVYLSAPGKAGPSNFAEVGSSDGSWKSSKNKVTSQLSQVHNSYLPESSNNNKGESSGHYDSHLWFGPRGNGGSNNLYPGDIIPFTRRPLFLIIDSDNSHAFKVLHGAERGETAALLLSPLRPAFKNTSDVDLSQNGSQFTFFLTAPLPAFCQMLGISSFDTDTDVYNNAEDILSTAFSEWEVILCTSTSVDIVWAQVLNDPFIRRLILRFIFCRAVLSFFCHLEDIDQYVPVCLPHLPSSVAPSSDVVRSSVHRLAKHLGVAGHFHFENT
ncbi:protein SCAI-like [Juglans microcarpa x Juglans regia]|uniref:protein SCAI-like n=1 Tax=Juglans microcarpa x Juglans regia TaxID=2249226 RepID=UPI001B7F20A7|nr:protein SCAI-like [Juglans microcarpa x Juglans regia]XP_041005355.1 protein SCAI-like [Juglans microcarpa x Juglans regia]